MNSTLILQTSRLTLRPIAHKDSAQLFAIRKDPEMMRYIPRPLAVTMEDAQVLIDKMIKGIEDNIMVIKNPYVPIEPGRFDQIPAILNSITRQKVLQMKYFTAHSQEMTQRDVEPVGIFYSLGQWYMIAFCLLRQSYRNFRIDRIQEVSITQKAYSQDHPSLSQYLDEVSRDQRELTKVVIRVDKEALRYLGEQKYYQGFVSEVDLGDEVEMTFLSCSLSGFARWILWFADQVTIIEPVELTEEVRRYLKPLISKFGVNM